MEVASFEGQDALLVQLEPEGRQMVMAGDGGSLTWADAALLAEQLDHQPSDRSTDCDSVTLHMDGIGATTLQVRARTLKGPAGRSVWARTPDHLLLMDRAHGCLQVQRDVCAVGTDAVGVLLLDTPCMPGGGRRSTGLRIRGRLQWSRQGGPAVNTMSMQLELNRMVAAFYSAAVVFDVERCAAVCGWPLSFEACMSPAHEPEGAFHGHGIPWPWLAGRRSCSLYITGMRCKWCSLMAAGKQPSAMQIVYLGSEHGAR